MAKDNSIDVTTVEIRPDDASDHPITRENATHDTQPKLPQWPAEPLALTPKPTTERWLLAYDVGLCLVPLALIAKVILCIVASVIDKGDSGSSVDEVHALTVYLIRFNHQLTTIFTVVFILIITTVVRRLALYMAQEGATVAKLEQLQASISLPGTLKAIWSLRSFTSRTSAILILIWGWFYLGSQATTSEYEYKTSGAFRKMPFAYYSSQKQSMFWPIRSDSSMGAVSLNNINSMFNTFSGPISYGSENSIPSSDLNGASLIPFVFADGSLPEGGKLSLGRHSYYDVSQSSTLNFVSWVGISVYTVGSNESLVVNSMEGTYHLNTTYLNASCTRNGLSPASAFPKNVSPTAMLSISATSSVNSSILKPWDPPVPFDVWLRWDETSESVHASCRIHQIPVQLKVGCSGGKCSAKKMRFTPGLSRNNRTAFDDVDFTNTFFKELTTANGPLGWDTDGVLSSVVENIITSMHDVLYAFTGDGSWLAGSTPQEIEAKDNTKLSQRMTTLINTYYQVSQDPSQGSFEDSFTDLRDAVDIINGKISSEQYLTGVVKGALYNPQYRLSIPWIIVDLISCLILLAAALLSARLRQLTLAPDIFGYVSSLTRDNPHLNLPDGGSTMSGLARARALKHVRVKIADVADEHGVGKVGLRHAADLNVEMAHLKRDRQYV